MNCTQTISSVWFGISERGYSTGFLNFIINFSTGVAALLPPYFINTENNEQEILNQLEYMMRFFAILGTAASVPCLFFLRSKPPTPPSPSVDIERFDFFGSLQTTFSTL